MDRKFFENYKPVFFKLMSNDSNAVMVKGHGHNSIELLYCINGMISVEYEVNDNHYTREMDKNAFCIILPGIKHKMRALEDKTTYYCLEIANSNEKTDVFTQMLYSGISKYPQLYEQLSALAPVSFFMDSNNLYDKIKNLALIISEIDENDYTFYLDYFIKIMDILLSILKCKRMEDMKVQGNLFINLSIAYINRNFARNDLSVSEIARELGISQGYLQHLFKKDLGKTLKEYITSLRINQAMTLFRSSRLSANEIAKKVGFSNYSSLYKQFTKLTGMSPSDFQKKENEFFVIINSENS